MCCCNKPNTEVKDPVCGMTVDRTKSAGSSEYQRTTYFFCSAGCKRKFDAVPDQHVQPPGCCAGAAPGAEAQTVIDPVCGMKVGPAKAAESVEHNGTTFHFCSRGCAVKFRADPEKYLHPQTAAMPKPKPTDREKQMEYVCPMDPEVSEIGPGSCPKCGMALEPAAISAPATRIEYTCPMHPQGVRSEPGNCPICGMALEPREITMEETNPELADMTRRFWISVALAIPMLALMASEFLPSKPLQHLLSARSWAWIEFALASPVVLWCGWPFFVRGWQSVINRSLNMFTLIALGTGAAYLYSVAATIVPQIFRPHSEWLAARSGCTSSRPQSSSLSFFWGRLWNYVLGARPAAPFAPCSDLLQKWRDASMS